MSFNQLTDGQWVRRMEFVEILHDRTAVLRRICQLAEMAKFVHGVLCGAWADKCDPALLECPAAGSGRRRLLVDPRLVGLDRLRGQASGRRTEVRVHDGTLRHMLIFGTRFAVLPLDEGDLDAGALVLHTPIAVLCNQLFDLLWANSRPLDSGLPARAGLSVRQLGVAELLVEGATDHQVANRLGLSSRTVRTVVAELQHRFGTTSRMALGFRLGAQGVRGTASGAAAGCGPRSLPGSPG
ncbi:LuxR C-terminal-related transcriptional regulator [Amycolatopsis sp. NPDC058986]|uniref:helix-turn-helix transcriptional regulator n=1 Tax=unclassified Amycolatopsis TaxID=2618356 RepID=UPI00366EB9E1